MQKEKKASSPDVHVSKSTKIRDKEAYLGLVSLVLSAGVWLALCSLQRTFLEVGDVFETDASLK